MMAFVFARIVIACVAAVVLIAGGLILVGIGDVRGALRLGIVCALVFMVARPGIEDRAAFAEFQKQRERFPPPR